MSRDSRLDCTPMLDAQAVTAIHANAEAFPRGESVIQVLLADVYSVRNRIGDRM